MGICYIVGAGDFTTHFTPTDSDLVIAADGGYDSLTKTGIRCDLLIGDLDSITEVPTGVKIIRYPVKKDETDMMLAYLAGAERGYTDFEIHGATGGRQDHTFANYCLLLYMSERGHRGSILCDTGATLLLKNGSIEVTGECGKHFSAFAFGGEAVGVTIRGLEYECEGVTLTPEFPLAVSNRFIGKVGQVEVKRGALLLMIEK